MIRIQITAAVNSANEVVFNVVDQNNAPVNLTARGATLVTVSVCTAGCAGASIDSAGDAVSFNGDVVRVKFGRLALPPSRGAQVYLPKIGYITAQSAEPEIIAGEGFNTEIQLRMVC